MTFRGLETGLAAVLDPGSLVTYHLMRYDRCVTGRIESAFLTRGDDGEPLQMLEVVVDDGDGTLVDVIRADRIDGYYLDQGRGRG